MLDDGYPRKRVRTFCFGDPRCYISDDGEASSELCSNRSGNVSSPEAGCGSIGIVFSCSLSIQVSIAA